MARSRGSKNLASKTRGKSLPGNLTNKSDLTVRDVPSKGLSARLNGRNLSDIHHVFSTLERRYFYTLLWSDSIIDLDTQKILPLDETVQIAERLQVRHPKNTRTGELHEMSSDFVITCVDEAVQRIKVRSVKPKEELEKRRTIEKLEIERVYWAEKEIDWGIVTENQIPMTLAENVEWIYEAHRITPYSPLTPETLPHVMQILYDQIQTTHESLATSSMITDKRLGLPSGTSLWAFKHFIVNRIWTVRMDRIINPSERIEVQFTADYLDLRGERA